MEGNILYRQQVKKSLNFHHQREPETGTVKNGLIFNYESMDAHQTFEGNLLGSRGALKEVLALFPNAQTAYIGRSRNAQYGKIRFEFISKEPEEFVSEIDAHAINTLEIEDGEISLTLLSNTLIYNDNGLSTTEVTELEKLLRKSLGNNVTVKKAFVKTDEVENFVSVWRLRRPSETCFKASSCFLLKGVTREHIPKIKELQKDGIGERRGEGFGRIAFGWQSESKDTFTLREADKKKLEKPSGNIPHQTREIVQTIVKDFMRKKVALSALRKVKEFVHEGQKDMGLPSKSLIGRLEAMVKSLGKEGFCEELENLRDTAKDKLKGCKDMAGSQTLFEYLKDHGQKFTVEKILMQSDVSGISDIKALCNEIGFMLEDDKNFEDALYRNYFQTFFSEMRRILKGGKSVNG
ncbi:MAG: hypothetical protein ACK41Q_04930 [Candidatus Brocadia sp.]